MLHEAVGHEGPAQRRDLGNVREEAQHVAQNVAAPRKVQRERAANGIQPTGAHDLQRAATRTAVR